MQIKIFNIPIPGGEQMNDEKNAFLRTQKVLQTESQVVSNAQGTFWCFCVKYLDETPQGKIQKVDYREVLDEATFQRFAEMRKVRKQLAQDEGIPAYAIFTDEELAGLAKLETLTLAAMRNVKGIGEKKVEKYGNHFINQQTDETGK